MRTVFDLWSSELNSRYRFNRVVGIAGVLNVGEARVHVGSRIPCVSSSSLVIPFRPRLTHCP